MNKILEVKKRIASEMPWVTRLVKAEQCDGKSGRCKFRAYWKFQALKSSYAKDGTYCWNHLIHRGFYYDMVEEARLNKWLTRHYPDGLN